MIPGVETFGADIVVLLQPLLDQFPHAVSRFRVLSTEAIVGHPSTPIVALLRTVTNCSTGCNHKLPLEHMW